MGNYNTKTILRPNKKISAYWVTGRNILCGVSTHFLCRLRSMVDTYGSCLRWIRCRHCPRCHTFGFHSITLEGMHRFHSNFTEGSSIIKYRASMKGGNPQCLNALWPFLNYILGKLWNSGFRSINFEGIQQFHSNFTEVYSIIKYRPSSN